MKAVNIRWDTSDGNGNDEPVDLPTEMDIPDTVVEGLSSREEVLDAVSDWLSDETGFCHFGFELK